MPFALIRRRTTQDNAETGPKSPGVPGGAAIMCTTGRRTPPVVPAGFFSSAPRGEWSSGSVSDGQDFFAKVCSP